MSSPKYFAIYNPKARGGRTHYYSEQLETRLGDMGIDIKTVSTHLATEVATIAEQAVEEGYNRLVAIGGDGTVHHVGNAALNLKVPFAVIPAGSGNDFAASLGLPNDIDHSIETILNDRIVKLNTILSRSSVGDFWTINVADAGMGAMVSRAAETRLKWMAGQIKYDLIAMWEIIRHKKARYKVYIDGEESEIDGHMVIAGLGQTAGSGMNFFPDVRFNHETMQGGIITSDCSKLQLIRALQKVRVAEHKDLPYIKMFRAKELRIECAEHERELLVESEGELRGTTPLSMKVIENYFPVVVPESFTFDLENLIAQKQKSKKRR